MGGQDNSGAKLDKAGQAEIEGRGDAPTKTHRSDAPLAGPHAEPSLTNPEATPGAGSLPSQSPDDEADAATG